MMKNKAAFYLDLLERSVWTFIQAFAAQLIASGIDLAGTDLSIGQKASVAAIGGAIAVLKALAVNRLPWTAVDSASTLPEAQDPPVEEPPPAKKAAAPAKAAAARKRK